MILIRMLPPVAWFACFTWFTCCAGIAGDGSDVATAPVALEPAAIAESISEESLHRHVRHLADDAMEGRGAGTRGAERAADYLVEQMEQAGLAPRGSDGFRQPFAARGRALVNLIGVLPGSDAALKDEYVVLGAHYDHEGIKNGEIYNGADDNASGCAVLIEVARALAAAGGCRRSILFVAFDGEEINLLGSKHFVANPVVPRAAIVAMFNMDMVSRGETGDVRVCGTPCSAELKAIVEGAAPRAQLTLHYDMELAWRRASDHAPFDAARIPWLYFGVLDHEDYHKPTDDADKSNREKMLRIARLVYLTLRGTGDTATAPVYVDAAAAKKRQS